MKQRDIVTPLLYVVRLSNIGDDAPEKGDVIFRAPSNVKAREYVRNAMRLHQLRNADSWETSRGLAFWIVGEDVYHIEKLSLAEYTAQENQ